MNTFGNIVIPFNAMPEPHEMRTAKLLITLGHDVEFIAPSFSKGVRTPDIEWGGVRWEIKCPCGNSKRTIENNYRYAERQSENIIFDIRQIKLSEAVAISIIKREFAKRTPRVQRVMIITKNNKILDLSRYK